MHHRNSKIQDRGADGISEVVGFVIILAVVMAAMSLYLTYAVPVQGREGEITVMDGVRTWFVDYKTEIDQLWLNSPLAPASMDEPSTGQMLHDATAGKVTLRKMIDPGTAHEKGFVSRYLPVLAPIPCSGEVSVRDGDYLEIGGKIKGQPIDPVPTISAPALVYTSNNYYWFQQEYSYQLGGVFLRQWDRDGERVTVVAAPPLSIYGRDAEHAIWTRVELVAVNLNGDVGGVGSTSPIKVETRLDADPTTFTGLNGNTAFSEVTLTFHAVSEEAAETWVDVFRGAALRNGISLVATRSGTDTSITVPGPADDATLNDVLLEVLDASYTLRLDNVPTMIE